MWQPSIDMCVARPRWPGSCGSVTSHQHVGRHWVHDIVQRVHHAGRSSRTHVHVVAHYDFQRVFCGRGQRNKPNCMGRIFSRAGRQREQRGDDWDACGWRSRGCGRRGGSLRCVERPRSVYLRRWVCPCVQACLVGNSCVRYMDQFVPFAPVHTVFCSVPLCCSPCTTLV